METELILEAHTVPKKRHLNDLAVNMHRKLLQLHGITAGEKCGDCKFFNRYRFGQTFNKCSQTHRTNSQATDWRVKWQACQLFQKS